MDVPEHSLLIIHSVATGIEMLLLQHFLVSTIVNKGFYQKLDKKSDSHLAV